jgi:hypothetical protein
MSKALWDTGGMNMKRTINVGGLNNRLGFKRACRVIAVFGTARLVHQPTGRYELIGGSAANCSEAREWCSLFAPEVVFGAVPRGSEPFTFVA